MLFTSYLQMRQIYQFLKPHLEHVLLLQGDAPRTALLNAFRETPGAVLFGTSSFWQGVDVQGDQLSCVIIDRLPFAVPAKRSRNRGTDRRRARERRKLRFLNEYQIPRRLYAKARALDVLIRGTGDRGVLALLDNRITKLPYRRVFFDSLPAYRFTTKFEDVQEFFNV